VDGIPAGCNHGGRRRLTAVPDRPEGRIRFAPGGQSGNTHHALQVVPEESLPAAARCGRAPRMSPMYWSPKAVPEAHRQNGGGWQPSLRLRPNNSKRRRLAADRSDFLAALLQQDLQRIRADSLSSSRRATG
jgi:hypothetical protein